MNDHPDEVSPGKWWEYLVILAIVAPIVGWVGFDEWKRVFVGPVGYVFVALLLVVVLLVVLCGLALLFQSTHPLAVLTKYAILLLIGLVTLFVLVKFIRWAWYY